MKDGKTKPTKSKAEEIKEAIENNQVGKPDAAEKLKPALERLEGKKPKAKAKQMELPKNKVKMDATGKAARRFRQALEALEVAQDEKGAASENLLKTMRKAKRLNITVDGYRFEVFHQGPKDTVKVQKPK